MITSGGVMSAASVRMPTTAHFRTLPSPLGADEAGLAQKRQKDGKLKAEAEGEDELEREVGRFTDRAEKDGAQLGRAFGDGRRLVAQNHARQHRDRVRKADEGNSSQAA